VRAWHADADDAAGARVELAADALETTYTWTDTATGATRMTLRNRGEPSGFSTIAAPLMAAAMRRANRKDLDRLKQILEAASV
jgi:hypothetical protein